MPRFFRVPDPGSSGLVSATRPERHREWTASTDRRQASGSHGCHHILSKVDRSSAAIQDVRPVLIYQADCSANGRFCTSFGQLSVRSKLLRQEPLNLLWRISSCSDCSFVAFTAPVCVALHGHLQCHCCTYMPQAVFKLNSDRCADERVQSWPLVDARSASLVSLACRPPCTASWMHTHTC